MRKVVYVSGALTSAEFYKVLLPEIRIALRYYDQINDLVIDFSGTSKIEPNVIPNLLCLGRVIKSVLGYEAIIRIPDTFEGGRLKNYLYQIDFLSLAKGIYIFEQDPYTGFEGRTIDPLSGTVYLDSNATLDEISRTVNLLMEKFAMKYLRRFEVFTVNGRKENIITHLMNELLANAVEYGNSYSYTTVHAKYSKRIIYVAISDGGEGFLKSCKIKHAERLKKEKKEIHNELEAIIYCLYVRENSKDFGLHAAVNDVLAAEGKVRIHSNDSQVIITPKTKMQFLNKLMLKDSDFQKYNVKRNMEFGGSHIELEIPF